MSEQAGRARYISHCSKQIAPQSRLSRHLSDLPSWSNLKALLMSEKGILCVMKPSKFIVTSWAKFKNDLVSYKKKERLSYHSARISWASKNHLAMPYFHIGKSPGRTVFLLYGLQWRTPVMHLSTSSGSWDLPLMSPNMHPVIRRPSKSSIGCSGIILGVPWIPSTTVRPQPCVQICFSYCF